MKKSKQTQEDEDAVAILDAIDKVFAPKEMTQIVKRLTGQSVRIVFDGDKVWMYWDED